MNKNKILNQIINLFFDIEGIKASTLEELPLSTRKSLIRRLRKDLEVVSAVLYFLELSLPSDKRFLRVDVRDKKDKFLVKPIKVSDWAYSDFPFIIANKKFLTGCKWLIEYLEEKGYKVKIVRGFLPMFRVKAFSWTYRLLAHHGKGKAMDIIIENKTPAETLEILRQNFENFPNMPYPFFFAEVADGVHVGFAPFGLRKRFFSKYSLRVKLCPSFMPNQLFLPGVLYREPVDKDSQK